MFVKKKIRQVRSLLKIIPALVSLNVCISSAIAASPIPQIRLVVPFSPGGAVDTIGRQLAINLGEKLGQSVIVENRPGASGIIGVMSVVNSTADGTTTLVLAPGSLVAVDPIQEKLQYVPQRDLAIVAPVATIPYVVVVNNTFPAHNITELLALANNGSSHINFASSGIGTPPHLASELLLSMGKAAATHIPYKGAVPALTDLSAGEVQFMSSDINTAMSFLKEGRIRAIATTGKQRSDLLPNIPTVNESGIPGYSAEGWFGVFARSNISADIQAQLKKAVVSAVQEADFKKRISFLGGSVLAMSTAEFSRFIADETTKRSDLIKTNHIELGK